MAFQNHARAYLSSDARRPRPSDVTRHQGLPSRRQGRLTILVQTASPQPLSLRLGTLNIGTMTGRSRELSDAFKRRRVDVACVQEFKWTLGRKLVGIGDGFKLIYNDSRLKQKRRRRCGQRETPGLRPTHVRQNRIWANNTPSRLLLRASTRLHRRSQRSISGKRWTITCTRSVPTNTSSSEAT